MTEKDLVIEAVKELPDQSTFKEILEHLAIFQAIRRGEQAADAGKVVSHEEVKKRVATWISGL